MEQFLKLVYLIIGGDGSEKNIGSFFSFSFCAWHI